jgi:hypothetical protein
MHPTKTLVLRFLERNPNQTINQVSKEVGVGYIQTGRLLRSLYKMGLLNESFIGAKSYWRIKGALPLSKQIKEKKMNKFEHLEMMDTPYTSKLPAEQITELSLHKQNLASLLRDCLEFVPSDLRRKIENAIRD